jgi:uncharacterized protein (TIGR03382 family)
MNALIRFSLPQAVVALAMLGATSTAFAQVPPFTAEEIATTPGSTAFDNGTGVWTIEAEGADIWNNADQFRYTHIPLTGDGEVIARVVSLGPVTGTAYDQWAKAGVMIRQSNAAGSVHAFMAVTGNNGACFQSRAALDGASANTGNTGGAFVANRWVRLVRAGNNFSGYWSDDPTVGWTQIGGAVAITMTDPVLVGLALTSHQDAFYVRGVFDRLRITQNGTVIYEWLPPAPANLIAQDGIFQIDVSWGAVAGATTYTLERTAASTGTVVTFTGLTTTSYTDTNVTVGETYAYRARAVVNGLAGAWSNTDTAMALLPPPRTEGHSEGLFDENCACGSTASPASLGALALLGLAALRRRRPNRA